MWSRQLFALAAASLFVVALWAAQEAGAGKSPNKDLVQRDKDNWLDAMNTKFCGQRHTEKPEPVRPEPRRGLNGTSRRISGGRKAWDGEFPWHAHITYVLPRHPNRRLNCSGVWIHENLVLTAAHCVLDMNGTSNAANDIGVSDWRKRYNRYEVEAVLIHTGFPQIGLYGTMRPPSLKVQDEHCDIAVLRLKRSIRYYEHIQPACLPRKYQLVDNHCHAVGWGLTQTKPKWNWPNELMTMPMTKCPPEPDENEARRLYDDVICHTSANRKEYIGNACYGDDGGGVFCRMNRDRGRWYVMGIMSEQNYDEICYIDFSMKKVQRSYYGDLHKHYDAIVKMARQLLDERGMLPGQENFRRTIPIKRAKQHGRKSHRKHHD